MKSLADAFKPAAALVLVWAAMAIAIWPVGEFAVNDDWGFSTPVKWWTEDGFLQFTFHQAMTLIAQVAIGFLWSEAFGYSHLGLRILVATQAALFVCFAYALARESGVSRRVSYLLPLLFLAFPHFVFCSVTFLTETPFLAFGAGSLYFFAVTIKTRDAWLLAYGAAIVFLLLAVLTRQIGIFIALGFMIGDISANGAKLKVILRGAAALILAIAIVVAYPTVADRIAGLPPVYLERTQDAAVIIRDILRFKLGALIPSVSAAYWGALYFGFLTTPLSAALAAARMRALSENKGPLLVSTAAAAILFLTAVVAGRPIPVPGDTLSSEGLGARFVQPYFPEIFPGAGWWLLTFVATASFGVLAGELWRAVARLRAGASGVSRDRIGIALMLSIAGLLSFAPYGLFYGPWYARYVLFTGFCVLLVFAILGVDWDNILRRQGAIMLTLAGVGAGCSVLLVHDFFEWSRMRYALIDEAIQTMGVNSDDLNGGFEFNNLRAVLKDPAGSLLKRLEPEEGGEFMLAKIPFEGYQILACRRSRQLFPLGNDRIYLLRRLGDAS